MTPEQRCTSKETGPFFELPFFRFVTTHWLEPIQRVTQRVSVFWFSGVYVWLKGKSKGNPLILTPRCAHISVVQWHPFSSFLVAAPLKIAFVKKGSLFFTVTEQLSVGCVSLFRGDTPTKKGAHGLSVWFLS